MTLTITDGRIHIDFNGILETAQRGTLRASAFAGFSLNAAAREDLRDFHPAGAYFRRVSEKLTDEQLAEWKDAYRQWIVGNSIRELVESFGLVLNSVYAACSFIRDVTRLPFVEIQQQCSSFDQRSENARLKALEQEFGITPALGVQLKSFIDIRNSLTHRWGQILSVEIVARWQRIQPFVQADDGAETIISIPVTEPTYLKAGGMLCIRVLDAEKTFAIGSSVNFEPFEVQEICQLFENSAVDLVKQLEAFAARIRPEALPAARISAVVPE